MFTKGQLVTVRIGGSRLGVVEIAGFDDAGHLRFGVRLGPVWRHFARPEEIEAVTWPEDCRDHVKAHMSATWGVPL